MLYMLACWVYVCKKKICMTSGFVFTSGFLFPDEQIEWARRDQVTATDPDIPLSQPVLEWARSRLPLAFSASRSTRKVEIRPLFISRSPSCYNRGFCQFRLFSVPGESERCRGVEVPVCRSDWYQPWGGLLVCLECVDRICTIFSNL